MGSQKDKKTDSKRIEKGQKKDDYPFLIPFLSFFYLFDIRLLSFFYPFAIPFLSFSYPFATPSFFYPFAIPFLSVSYPFATPSFFLSFSTRFLSVSYPFAIPFFFYPFLILSRFSALLNFRFGSGGWTGELGCGVRRVPRQVLQTRHRQ